MRIEKSHIGTIISEVINGYRVQRVYIVYTLREAKKLFREEVKK